MSETWITVACTPQLNRLHRRDEVRWEVTVGDSPAGTFDHLIDAIARARYESKATGLPIRQIDAMGIERSVSTEKVCDKAPGAERGPR